MRVKSVDTVARTLPGSELGAPAPQVGQLGGRSLLAKDHQGIVGLMVKDLAFYFGVVGLDHAGEVTVERVHELGQHAGRVCQPDVIVVRHEDSGVQLDIEGRSRTGEDVFDVLH